MPGLFANRREAGRELADELMRFRPEEPIVLALPRGGVPVAFEVAEALGAPIDVVLVRKIGAPGHPELGLGAVVDGHDLELVLNDEVMSLVRPSENWLESEREKQLAEIERRRLLYRRGATPISVKGRSVIVIDDGIATGGTVKAVLRALARHGAAKRILAVPVAPRRSINDLKTEVDEVVCLAVPEPFYSVGSHYADFTQTSNEDVIELLDRFRERHSEAIHCPN